MWGSLEMRVNNPRLLCEGSLETRVVKTRLQLPLSHIGDANKPRLLCELTRVSYNSFLHSVCCSSLLSLWLGPHYIWTYRSKQTITLHKCFSRYVQQRKCEKCTTGENMHALVKHLQLSRFSYSILSEGGLAIEITAHMIKVRRHK